MQRAYKNMVSGWGRCIVLSRAARHHPRGTTLLHLLALPNALRSFLSTHRVLGKAAAPCIIGYRHPPSASVFQRSS
jgi:hypothetical protein